VVVGLALGLSAPAGAEDLAARGGTPTLLRDVATGQGLAVWARSAEDGSGFSDVVARPLDRAGRPAGAEVVVASDALAPPGLVGAMFDVALDTRRHRFVVVWSGWQPGMAEEACTVSGPPGIAPPCRLRDQELFVRVLDGAGRPLGDARRLTSTGRPDDVAATASAPALAYDARAHGYLLAYRVGTSLGRGALRLRRLGIAGVARGGEHAVRRGSSALPEARVVGGPGGGFVLVYTWGPELRQREAYARALRADGAPAGRDYAVSPRGGPGADGLEVAHRSSTLVVWAEARRGASDGFRARRLKSSGRPAGRAVGLPYEVGVGRLSAAPAGRGWVYAFTQSRPQLGHAVLVQRARGNGRVAGRPREVSGDDAMAPSALAWSGGRLLVGWTQVPVMRGSAPPPGPAHPRIALVRA
jgi:hypothetical protein